MVAVRHDDLSMAFDFVSCAAPMEHSAYISLDTISRSIRAKSGGLPIPARRSTRRYLTTSKPLTATLRYRTRASLISEAISPCALSHRRCLHVTSRSKNFSGDEGPMRVSRACRNVKAFSSAGTRLNPTLSKAR